MLQSSYYHNKSYPTGGLVMKPEDKREALQQQERISSPTANSRDSFERAKHGSLKDLSSGLSTKGLAIVIVVLALLITLIALL